MQKKKKSLVGTLLKNILLYGSLFIIMSIVIDWYRKPSAPAQFEQQVMYDIEQQPKVIAQLSAGKPMLLYFWGSWCHFCEFVSPSIQQIYEEKTGVLGVALKSGTVEDVKTYRTENSYTFPTLNDPTGDFSRGWDIQATPTILIVKDGKIINHTTGYTSYWGLKFRLWLANFAS